MKDLNQVRPSVHPTDFQKSIQTFLLRFSEDNGLSCKVESAGQNEHVDKYTFPSLQTFIWVYDDGGNIKTSGADIRFEIEDYQSISELAADFRKEIERHLTASR